MVIESIILICTCFAGLITLSIMLFSIKSNKAINLFWILIVALTMIRFILRSTYNLGLQDYTDDYSGPWRVIMVFNFPFYFLYFNSILDDTNVLNRKYLIHLIIPFLFIIYVMLMFAFGFDEMFFFKRLNYMFLMVLSLFYSFKSFYLLKNKLWNIPEKNRNNQITLIRGWTITIYILSIVMILRFILSLSFELYFNLSLKGEFLFVIQSLIWLIVFIKIIFTPEILFGIPKLQRKINPSIIQAVKTSSFWNFQKDSVPTQKDIKLQEKIDDNILNIVKEIDFLCIDQHFFRNQKVNILELSKEMNIPLSHLIYVFKYHCNVSFTEYKTHIKIEDAKKLIESGFLKSNTLESLAINVGFSSYNPFFTAFKKLQGMSPNEYSLSLLSRN